MHVSIDGRYFTNLAFGDSCTVKASDKVVKMLSFIKNNSLKTLFSKMNQIEKIV